MALAISIVNSPHVRFYNILQLCNNARRESRGFFVCFFFAQFLEFESEEVLRNDQQ